MHKFVSGLFILQLLSIPVHAQDPTRSERKEIAVSPAILAIYVGTYQLSPVANMMITLDGDKLMAQPTGQAKAQLYAESETRFFLKITDAQIVFVKDGDGKVTHLLLNQGGREFKAMRTSDTVAERKAVSLPRAILEKYVGTYELRPGLNIMITLEGDQLMGQATGQNKFPLFAESETKFFGKAVDVQVEFGTDETGAFLDLHQGPINLRGRRK